MLAIRTYCLIEQILTEYQWCSDTRLGAGMSLVRERGKQLRHGVRNNYSTYCWRRHWYPTPVLLPGKSHGWRSLEGCSPWGHWESDTTEWLHFDFSLSCIGEGNGNPLQCSCLENPSDGGAWWAAIYGVAQSRTRLKPLGSSSSSSSTYCWESEAGAGKWYIKLDFENLMKVCKVDEYKGIKGDRREHWRTVYTSVTDCWQSVQERSSREWDWTGQHGP